MLGTGRHLYVVLRFSEYLDLTYIFKGLAGTVRERDSGAFLFPRVRWP